MGDREFQENMSNFCSFERAQQVSYFANSTKPQYCKN